MPNTSINKIPQPSENGSNNASVVGQALQALENLHDGFASFDLSGGNKTVDDTTNYTNNAVYGLWKLTGTLTANRELIAPSRVWSRFVMNTTSGSFTAKVVLVAGGAGIVVPASTTVWLRCDGTTITSTTIPATVPTGTGFVHVTGGVQDGTATIDLDTDATLAANSDSNVPSQKAVKTYVATMGGSGLNPLGAWNASTNSPTLASGVGTKGDYYVVSTPGSTSIDGESDWGSKDWIIFNGTVWQKIDNSEKIVKYAQDIGDGTSTSITVTHSLGTQDLASVLIRENASPYTVVQPSGITVDDANSVTVTFSVAPTTNQYRAVVMA